MLKLFLHKRRTLGTWIFLLCLTSVYAPLKCWAENRGVYEANNISFQQEGVQAGPSGKVIFSDSFESSEVWKSVDNYRNLLDINFGYKYQDDVVLHISRTKPIDQNDPEGKDTAWGISTVTRSFDQDYSGKPFVLRLETTASKSIVSSVEDGRTYHCSLEWYDDHENTVASTPFLFTAGLLWNEMLFHGIIPKDANSYSLRLGFDAPNLEPGEFAVVRKATLEVVDPEKQFVTSGSFISGVFEGGEISWEANVPTGTSVVFQVATADSVEGEPGVFSDFKGPDGTANTYFNASFVNNAPFVRYRVMLMPNGVATPTLKSVRIGNQIDSNWSLDGDSEPPRVKLVGAYATPSRECRAPIDFELLDASIVRTSSIKISVDDVDVTSLFSLQKNAHGVLQASGSLKQDLEEGLHCLVVEASDLCGNSGVATRYFLIGDEPTTPKISLRDDGITLIDGTPFFPIGIYGVCERDFNGNDIDAAFKGLKEAGFNFAHSYSIPREDRFLRAAEKYDFKLWSVARFPDERFVDIERHSPAIIAWYLGDDTSANTKPWELYNYHDSVKAVDPTRLTVQADPICSNQKISNYRPYVSGTDAFLPEIYPIRKDVPRANEECVFQTIQDVKRSRSDAFEAANGPKAIWPIIQYFQGWGWQRFPTYRELRAMSFGALAAGANGITWYTYGGFVEPEKKRFNYGVTTSPDRWSNISKIATQINALSSVLLERTNEEFQPKATVLVGPKRDVYDNESIVSLLKLHEGKTYLVVVNASPESVYVQLDFPVEQNFSAFEALFEEPTSPGNPSLSNGVLREKIEGFGVRIYRW